MAKKTASRPSPGSARHPYIPRKSPKDNTLFIWSIHPVLEALRQAPACIEEIILQDDAGARIENLIALAEDRHITVRYDRNTFQKGGGVAGERHQGVAARIAFPYVDISLMLDTLARDERPPFVLILDSIQDPQNLGAIIRSAVAAGCTKLILPKDRSARITGIVAKTSAGGIFHLDVCLVTNLATTIDALRETGIWVFGTSAEAPLPIYKADFTVPLCLVIGNEEKGVRPLVQKHCDGLVSIPMAGSLDSLNASVAAGVVLFEVARQRAL